MDKDHALVGKKVYTRYGEGWISAVCAEGEAVCVRFPSRYQFFCFDEIFGKDKTVAPDIPVFCDPSSPNPRVEVKAAEAKGSSVLMHAEYQTAGSAAIDLRANIEHITQLFPDQQLKIGSGISINLKNANIAAFILPRSGLGTKGLNLANTVGLIDSDYQGEIMITVKNTGSDSLRIHPMDRIAQLVFLPILRPLFEYVTEFSTLTERGANGFGSTGSD